MAFIILVKINLISKLSFLITLLLLNFFNLLNIQLFMFNKKYLFFINYFKYIIFSWKKRCKQFLISYFILTC